MRPPDARQRQARTWPVRARRACHPAATAAARAAAAPTLAVRPGIEQQLSAAVSALRNEQLEAAEQHLLAVLRQCPAQPDALHFLGVLRHTQGRSDDAIRLIRAAGAALPQAAGPMQNLGNVLLESGQVDQAVAAYRAALERTPPAVDAAGIWCNLALIERRRGRLDAAEAACRRAVSLAPDSGDAWYQLSATLMAAGRVPEGLQANSRAIVLWPRHLQARQQVIRALILLGERAQAAALYQEWLAEEPDNAVVQHQLAACLGEAVPARASDAYVEQVFDSFASSFDAKLQSLDYQAPALVTQALQDAVGAPRASLLICDAGCGTGLCGPLLRPWASLLAGCDLSVGMLKQAHRRGHYDRLHKAELGHYLRTQPEAFEAVVSADTLCYFGDLAPPLQAARVALRPGGVLVFTVEALASTHPAAHQLQPSGRYAHRADELHRCLSEAGLTAVALQSVTLRMEAARPVAGHLCTAQRPKAH